MLDRLAGNEAMKQHLQAALAGGKLAHSLLLCGEKGCGAGFAARCLAADYLYPQGGPAAEAVLAGQAPECLEVRGEGASGQIRIERIRQVREEVFHSALSAQGRVVLLYGAQNLNSASANALLKVLEEPPGYGVFVLLTTNPDALLPTVRSRCTEIRMQALPRNVLLEALARQFPQAEPEDLQAAANRSGGFLGQAQALLAAGSQIPEETRLLVDALCRRDSLKLTQVLVPMEKWKRDALADTLKLWQELLESALATACGSQAVSPLARALAASRESRDLYAMYETVKKAREYTLSNVSPAAVCGFLAWALR